MGMDVIRKNEPAKNQGNNATGGAAPTYSSCLGIRAARISATPCMATARARTAAPAQASPVVAVAKVAPSRGGGRSARRSGLSVGCQGVPPSTRMTAPVV